MSSRVLPFDEGSDLALAALEAGQLVILPTETVYGIAARCDRPAAVAALYAAKRRSANQPLQVLVGSAEQAVQLVAEQNVAAQRLCDAFWPGPLTIALPASPSAPPEVLAADGTIGLRCPAHAQLCRFLLAAGPLAASSANHSGEPPTLECAAAVAALGDLVAIALDGGRCELGEPSTVVRIAASGELEILRAGAIPEPKLLEALARA